MKIKKCINGGNSGDLGDLSHGKIIILSMRFQIDVSKKEMSE